jgi:hypothetical protein
MRLAILGGPQEGQALGARYKRMRLRELLTD